MTPGVASTTEAGLARTGARVLARIADSNGIIDLALAVNATHLAVVRCVERIRNSDHAALETMVADGDFAWAGLVYSEQLGQDWPGHIEAFHVSELPRLIGRLQELQRAAAS
ncbi:MAG: hypothetical protein WAU68_00910 [Vitreimonas sp.]